MNKEQALKRAKEDADQMQQPMVVGQSYRPGYDWVVIRKAWLDSWDGKNQAKILNQGQEIVYPTGQHAPSTDTGAKPHWSRR